MKRTAKTALPLARRTALMLPLAALGGCGMFDGWFGSTKPPLPGKRYDVMPARDALKLTEGRSVTVPPVLADTGWPQPGAGASP